MVKYSGRFVVEDKANNRKYLADLLFGWDVGDDLTPFTLGGNTNPTIASNGKLDLKDVGAGFGASWAKRQVKGVGEGLLVKRFRFTVMADDTNSSGYLGFMDNSITGGFSVYIALLALSKLWNNVLGPGTFAATGVSLVKGQEYLIELVKTPTRLLYLIDHVLIATVEVPYPANAPLSLTPQQSWCANNEYCVLYSQHGAGEIVHYQVRDIKVGRLVGVSPP